MKINQKQKKQENLLKEVLKKEIKIKEENKVKRKVEKEVKINDYFKNIGIPFMEILKKLKIDKSKFKKAEKIFFLNSKILEFFQ